MSSFGEEVNWHELWAEMEVEFAKNEDFKNYILPHKNLAAIFIKLYQQEMKK